MPSLNLSHQKIQETPPIVQIAIGGEVDATTGRQAETYFDTVLQTEQPRHTLLDLSGVTFGDSAFLSSLLFWKEEMVKRGGRLVLFGLRPELASTLRLVSLDRVLTVRPDRAAALASLPKE